MEPLGKVVSDLNELFAVEKLGKDPAFSRFIPQAYEQVGFAWREFFEEKFCGLFNGLMIKGNDHVSSVFLAVFPTEQVLCQFIETGQPGDLLFMHHPLHMECGDPRGQWGRGFVPIDPKLLHAIKERRLSVYTCHLPMDYNERIGTTAAMCEALGAKRIGNFYSDEHGSVGAICEIPETSTDQLCDRLKEIFQIPYVDFEGKHHDRIRTVAVVAGCGDVVDRMKEAESKGAQAYITGEIHCHIDNDYGRTRFEMMMEYVRTTSMSLIGVSHAASEYLVKKTQMKNWFNEHHDVQVKLIPQHKWWL
ncbi:MAG: Nif3-like dinuclear metal center hexameric protein [Alicyclobacillus macrosporangiidus]|uniref:Nif3-like dinuclear metal center hexameric protein n=1 Tax=Alicyclobacillus macrosporangiidus TaxID=392015 RepID=UPI0026F1F517|nr:Nif3-like dinuclear metal center hexameric protein [Alicyclobacillus macrosporangiidus]MCL6600686.1 Nif3-like dinuclear metal center hexameric protein [Alicyclobacillus macrosporangiidus]